MGNEKETERYRKKIDYPPKKKEKKSMRIGGNDRSMETIS
jgi:hypothetical protein